MKQSRLHFLVRGRDDKDQKWLIFIRGRFQILLEDFQREKVRHEAYEINLNLDYLNSVTPSVSDIGLTCRRHNIDIVADLNTMDLPMIVSFYLPKKSHYVICR